MPSVRGGTTVQRILTAIRNYKCDLQTTVQRAGRSAAPRPDQASGRQSALHRSTPAPQGDASATERQNPIAMLANAAPPRQSAPAALADGARARLPPWSPPTPGSPTWKYRRCANGCAPGRPRRLQRSLERRLPSSLNVDQPVLYNQTRNPGKLVGVLQLVAAVVDHWLTGIPRDLPSLRPPVPRGSASDRE